MNIQNRFFSLVRPAIVFSMAFASMGRALAGDYPIANSSFESPALTAGGPFVSSISGWNGTSLGTARAASFGLAATSGTQVAYNQNSPGNNFVMTQSGTVALAPNTCYNMLADLRPLTNDPSNNCCSLVLTRSTFGVNYGVANFQSNNLKPSGYASTDSYTLIPNQWVTGVVGFDSRDYPSDTAGSTFLQPLIQGYNMAVDNVRVYTGPNTYYISFSAGNNSNSGLDPNSPWKTFDLINQMRLGPGDAVLLKRGDTWSSATLNLTGKGAAGNPIRLTAYGEGPDPIITGRDLTTATCITLQNPSYFNVTNMDCRDAKVGLYLRYTGGNLNGTGAMFNNQSVNISHCRFSNMDEYWADPSTGLVNVIDPFELSWGAGIWIGGNIPSPPGGPWPSASSLILNALSVKHCEMLNCSTGVGTNWYFPPTTFRSRLTNLVLEDLFVTGCVNGSFSLFYVDGGHARRVDTWIGGDGWYAWGTTGGFVESCQNFTIDDCQFAGNKRNFTGPDGCGFDFEGNCDSMVFTNNVVHDNDGCALLVISTNGANTNLMMDDSTHFNNCRNPRDSSSNFELIANGGNSGFFRNNGVYRGANNAIGAVGLRNSGSQWGLLTGFTATRSGTAFSSVSTRPTEWGFDSSVEGWGSVNQWTGFAQSGGTLIGTSSGIDPYASSPLTWVNTRSNRWVRLRMSQTAGSFAQVFFITETDTTYDGDKSVIFPIIADGVMRDYIVDMSQCAFYRGIVTQFRLDPTDTAGSAMAIDSFSSRNEPYAATMSVVSRSSIDVTYNMAMLRQGGVMNPANYVLSGAGRGTLTASPSTVTMLPTNGGPVYRLQWATGSMVFGQPVQLQVSNATNARGAAINSSITRTGLGLPIDVSLFTAE